MLLGAWWEALGWSEEGRAGQGFRGCCIRAGWSASSQGCMHGLQGSGGRSWEKIGNGVSLSLCLKTFKEGQERKDGRDWGGRGVSSAEGREVMGPSHGPRASEALETGIARKAEE